MLLLLLHLLLLQLLQLRLLLLRFERVGRRQVPHPDVQVLV